MNNYIQEDALSPYQEKYKIKLAVFAGFLLILFILVYTSFFGGFSFTGSVVSEADIAGAMSFSADLTIPAVEIEGLLQRVELEGSSGSFLSVGGQKFSLENLSNNYIILEDFDGDISFNQWSIDKFSGKASKVIVNGVPIESESGKNLKVSFGSAFNYNSLEIGDNVYIKELDYNTTGRVNLNKGKNVFDISDEKIIIKKFHGSLSAARDVFGMTGHVKSLEVIGEQEISVGI